jgi:hypothetical protein
MHVVHDAGYCGHSNLMAFSHLTTHSACEKWVRDETAPAKKPKSFEQLFNEAWLIEYGGVYLKESWRDGQGRSHWDGGLESWIDVVAHLSYNHYTYTFGGIEDKGSEFQGQMRQQFVDSQRCGAGLLVDFFRKVGVIEEPNVNYLRGKEVWRVHLGGNDPERVGPLLGLNLDDLWPTISPNGYSKASLYQKGDKSKVCVNVDQDQMCTSWDFPDEDWPSAPKRVSRAFYPSSYFIALVDAAEGDNWRHLFLVPSVPKPNSWWTCKGTNQYFFDSPDGIWEHQVQKVDLPE